MLSPQQAAGKRQGKPAPARRHLSKGVLRLVIRSSPRRSGHWRSGAGPVMATEEFRGHAVRMSTQGSQPGAAPDSVAGTAGLPSGQSGGAGLRLGERPPPAMEKRGPYLVTRAPSIQAKLKKHRDHAKAVLRRKGMLGALTNRPDSSGKRSVKFNKGYTALSQSPDENLVSLDSDSR